MVSPVDGECKSNKGWIYKYSKTTVIYLVFILQGLSVSLLGPTLPDLCRKLGVTAEEISRAFSATSLCWMLGALASGVILDLMQAYLNAFLCFATTVMGLTTILKPFSPSLTVFTTYSCIEGVSWAFVDPLTNLGILHLWGEEADAPFQALYLMSSIGTLAGPFLCQPFLGLQDSNFNNTVLTTADPVEQNVYHQDSGYIAYNSDGGMEVARIEIPYVIAGSMTLIAGVASLVYQFIPLPMGLDVAVPEKQTVSEVMSPSKWVNSTTTVAISLVTLMIFFFFSLAGREFIIGAFLYSYGIDSKLSMSPQQAIYLDGLSKGFYMLGGVLAIFASKVLSPHMIIHISVCVSGLLAVGLATIGNNGVTQFFVFSCLMNFFTAPIWPGLITLLDKYIPVGAIILNFTTIGAALGGMFFMWSAGWLLTYREPESIMYLILLCSVLMTATLLGIQILASMKLTDRTDKGLKVGENDGQDIVTRF